MWNLCISLECVFQLQKYRAGKHLRWSHNSSPSPNSYSSSEFVIHGYCLAGLFSGTSGNEEPTSSPDICSSILFFSFSLLLQLFLLLYLPCYTSILLLFAVCSIKEQIVLSLLLHNHFWCTLEYTGITNFFPDIHYFFLNLVKNGSRSSNFTLSFTFCYRFRQMVHFPLHPLLFVCLSGLKSVPVKIQLVYNNRWISGFSISCPLLNKGETLPSVLAVILYTKVQDSVKYTGKLISVDASPPCSVAIKSHGNSAGFRSNWIFDFFYWTFQISSLWAFGSAAVLM